MQCNVQCVGTAVVALVWFWATGSGDAVLLPISGTGHQVLELHAVQSVVWVQEADRVPPSPKL